MSRSSKKTGKVYLIGAGLGPADLLTLRALDRLRRADVILHDRLIPREVLAHAAPHAKLMYVGKKASYHTLPQDEIEERLVRLARQGKTVARLKGGDPYIFGRGGEEAERLADEGIPFEVVPGISSALAGPLFAGVPLTHRRFTPSIAIVTGHENPAKPGVIPYHAGEERAASTWVDWQALSRMGTIVFLMGMGNLRANMQKLMEHGKPGDTPVAAVRWAGLGKQRTVLATVATAADAVLQAGLKSPAVIVVGGVAGLVGKLGFFARGALFGQSILITRDFDSNQVLAAGLRERSAHVIEWPGFKYQEIRRGKGFSRCLKKIARYDWLVFTSRRAVEFFLKKYAKVFSDQRALAQVKIAAVGEETSKALLENRLWVDLVPRVMTSEGLAQASVFKRGKGLQILLPCALDARGGFAQILGTRHRIDVVPIYRKRFLRQDPAEVARVLAKKPDWVIFYSPSALSAFLANFSGGAGTRLLKNTRIAVIGRTTAEHLRGLGIQPDVVALKPHTATLLAQLQRGSTG